MKVKSISQCAQVPMSQCAQVPMHVIKQNVYARVQVPMFDEKKDFLQDTYVSQDEVIVPGGVEVRRTVQPYEITPETVNSFSDGTNYRNDLAAAVSRPAPGQNIGDVSALTELLTKSPEEIRSILSRFSDMIKQAQSSAVEQPKPVENVEEVK